MGRRKSNKNSSFNNKNSVQECEVVNKLNSLSTVEFGLTDEAIEQTIYHKIEEIRSIMLANFAESRIMSCPYPSEFPCPQYRLSPIGLVNRRSSCFLISCIQTLFSLPPFVGILDKISVAVHSLFGKTRSLQTVWSEEQAKAFPLLRLLLLFLDEKAPYRANYVDNSDPFLPRESGPFSPKTPLQPNAAFFTQLNFEIGFQQDAADCMSRIITQLHEEMAALLRKHKPATTTSAKGGFDGDEDDDDAGWVTVASNGKKFKEARQAKVDNGEVTPISLLFGGTLVSRSSYQNRRSATRSDIGVKERFFVLPLELRASQLSTLEGSLKVLSEGETLTDFRDPATGQCVVMTRRVFIDRLPPLLLLQLNRFFYSTEEGSIRKVLKQISVPRRLQIQGSIINQEHSFSRAQGTYELKAVVFHIGFSAERGHYTVAVDFSETDDVVYFDDTSLYLQHVSSDNQQQSQQQVWWNDMFASHKPFHVRSGGFGSIREPTNAPGEKPPSIGEQPRTPYLLVYASCFSAKQ